MRTVINKTHRPLKIHLPRGKVLHLGPKKEGQIATHDLDSPGVTKLVEAGSLELVAEAGAEDSEGHADSHVHEDTHGHHPHTTIKKRGDR
jgi:hypothetical protein